MSFLENVDRKKLQQILLIVLAALVALALILLLVIVINSISSGMNKLVDYTITEKDYNSGSLVLADEEHPFESDESILDLVDCKGYRNSQLIKGGLTQAQIDDKSDPDRFKKLKYMPYNHMKLNSDTMTQAHKMLTDAFNATGTPITIDGAYGDQYFVEKTNEFDTGLLIFLSGENSNGLGDNPVYEPLPENNATWLDANCAKYGFIESFEDGYRYVGIPHAKYMTEKKLTLAAYIAELKKNNSSADKALEVKVGEETYSVYYVACNVGDEVKVPEGAVISGTNEGGIVVTVKK